tara:strand:+ start:325 stop:3078 length:2754 start_codon:yes stop_codon:yes gene_type:complete
MSECNEKSKIKQKKLSYKSLLSYMESCRITEKEDKSYTHTTLGNKEMGYYSAKYKFLEENKDYFYKLYTEWVFDNNCPTFLTEKHHPEYSPVLIDLDFRYDKNKEDKYYEYIDINEDSDSDEDVEPIKKKVTKWKRKYSSENIIIFLQKFIDILDSVLEIKDYQKVAYIMEKSTPIYDKEKKVMKDGLHIIFPYIVSSYEPLFYTRNKIIQDKSLENMFKEIGFKNDIDDIVDEAVIKRNNWFMYGSSKPGKESYKITDVISFDIDGKKLKSNGPKVEESNLQIVKLFSVYDFDRESICPIRKNTEFSSTQKKIEEKKTNSEFRKKIMKNKTNEDLKIIQKLVSILSPKRAENYNDWIRLGWCLHNIDYLLCETWDTFSSQSEKYTKGICEKEWNNMENRGLELGSLHRWAKKDSPDEYKKIIREDLNNLIKVSLNNTDYDIAKVVHKMLKHEFVCVSSKNKLWYQFKNHRWTEIDSATELKIKISEDVVNEYCNLAIQCNTEVMQTTDEDFRETLLKRAQMASKISLNLRKESFKNNVISACQSLFHDGKFLEKLDSNLDLIGFENGVYDLENGEFREGYPEDYISFSTKIDYIPMSLDNPMVKDVNKFIEQVLPISRVREYVLKILGSVLSGKTGQEKFHVWTGVGGNGKSKIIELLELAFGDYCGKLSITNITQKRPASNACTPELLKNKGKRFVTLQEPDDDEQIHVGAMKELTGGDKIQARGLHKDPIEFKPQWKIVMTSNVLPSVSANDNGTWRRIRVTEFISRFMEPKDMKPGKKYQFPIDYDLSSKLEQWPEAFMNILIHYYHKGIKEKIEEPPEVLKNTAAYKEESDCMLQFINECIEESLEEKIKVDVAYNVFKDWYKNSGETLKMPNKKDFRSSLSVTFGNPDSKHNWRGVTFINNNEDDDDEEDD